MHHSTPCRSYVPKLQELFAKESPMSMRYSVQYGKSYPEPAMSHQSDERALSSTTTAQVPTTKSEASTGKDLAREHAMHVINATSQLLLGMVVGTAVFGILSLQYYHYNDSNKPRALRITTYRNYMDILRDVQNCFDIAILLCTLVAFMVSLMQYFFLLKLSKYHFENQEIVLKYIKKTGFLRVVIYSFWFGAMVELGGNGPFKQSFDNTVFIIPGIVIVALIAFVLIRLKNNTDALEEKQRLARERREKKKAK